MKKNSTFAALFSQDLLARAVYVLLGVALSVLFKFLVLKKFGPYGPLGKFFQMLFFISVVTTVFLICYSFLEKWKINSKLTLLYLLIPGILYHIFLMLSNVLPLSIFTWTHLLFAGVVIPFTLYYIFEGLRNKRTLLNTLTMAFIIISVLVIQFHYIRMLPDIMTWSFMGILILFCLYLFLSIIVTLLFTGSFGVTVRYWEWLLTEPPKSVIRTIFQINRDKVTCRHCDRIIPLVGTYTCSSCKFTFKGHYFDWCPYCYSRFGYTNCECGLSRKRPLLF